MRGVRNFFATHKTGSLLAGLLIASTILMAATTSTISINPKQAGVAVFSLFQRGFAEIGGFVSRLVNSIGESRRLKKEYEELQTRIHDFRVNERELVELRQENERLKSQLEFTESLSVSYIPAEVIGHDPDDYVRAIVINKGSIHGIRRDMPVISYQEGFRALVGRIIQIGPVSSSVLPLYDVSCFVPARLLESRYAGLVNGEGNALGYLTMTTVPKSARGVLKVGDLVISSGLSTIYPKELYIGRIREIGAKAWESSLEIELQPIVDFSRLEYVFVLELEE